jgi:endonuclease/exonuclease/phosphatase family metal-dependent hydrolase
MKIGMDVVTALSLPEEVTLAFYNLENLFHPSDDPVKFDDDRTPDGADQWTYEKYNLKLANMAKAIAGIGPKIPSIVGLCELENRQVLQDLLNQEVLSPIDYGIIHFESPDLRGVDVGLIYRKSHFNPRRSLSISVPLYDEKKDRSLWTRDQLLVEGDLFGKPIYIMVNHWPSRSGGKQRSESKRISAAKVTKRVTDSLLRLNPQSQIVIMGDFNDNPDDPSIKKLIQSSTKPTRGSTRNKAQNHSVEDAQDGSEISTDFFNPMAKMYAAGIGSLAFRDQWFLFDQIIMTHNFMDKNSNWRLKSAAIHKASYLITSGGRFNGYPFRSVQGSHFTGGYSDHFPVYITLTK